MAKIANAKFCILHTCRHGTSLYATILLKCFSLKNKKSFPQHLKHQKYLYIIFKRRNTDIIYHTLSSDNLNILVRTKRSRQVHASRCASDWRHRKYSNASRQTAMRRCWIAGHASCLVSSLYILNRIRSTQAKLWVSCFKRLGFALPLKPVGTLY